MHEITGKITDLGSRTGSWGVLTYSYIDTGANTIKGLKIFSSLLKNCFI